MIKPEDIKVMLTSQTPFSPGKESSSIGGYASTTPFNYRSVLQNSVNLYSSKVIINPTLKGHITLGGEILNFDGGYKRGGFSTKRSIHSAGSNVSVFSQTNLFGFTNQKITRYRCLSIRNMGDSVANNFRIKLSEPPLGTVSSLQMALEVPSVEEFSSSTTSGTAVTLVDSSIAGSYPDGYFEKCILEITDSSSGNFKQRRVVRSFDGDTGTFGFIESMPSSVDSGISYRVGECPSLRISDERTEPLGNNIGPWRDKYVTLGDVSGRSSGSNLDVFETVYVWIKMIINDGEPVDFNRFLLDFQYKVV